MPANVECLRSILIVKLDKQKYLLSSSIFVVGFFYSVLTQNTYDDRIEQQWLNNKSLENIFNPNSD